MPDQGRIQIAATVLVSGRNSVLSALESLSGRIRGQVPSRQAENFSKFVSIPSISPDVEASLKLSWFNAAFTTRHIASFWSGRFPVPAKRR